MYFTTTPKKFVFFDLGQACESFQERDWPGSCSTGSVQGPTQAVRGQRTHGPHVRYDMSPSWATRDPDRDSDSFLHSDSSSDLTKHLLN